MRENAKIFEKYKNSQKIFWVLDYTIIMIIDYNHQINSKQFINNHQ